MKPEAVQVSALRGAQLTIGKTHKSINTFTTMADLEGKRGDG